MNKHYTIHDVAALLGISADAIRLYEKEGLVEPIRNPQNGYRYYGFEQIHRIMGISLYRQLDVGIAEIKELLTERTFDGICARFGDFIEAGEWEIARLQQRIGKMRFMQQHLASLGQGVGNCSIRELPDCYVLFHQDSPALKYNEMRDVITSPNFSFGNFCYILRLDGNAHYACNEMEFLVRRPMLELTSYRDAADSLPMRAASRCVYTVKKALDSEREHWDLTELYRYAGEQGVRCGSEAYAFYVYSMMGSETIDDYYEIYLPIDV